MNMRRETIMKRNKQIKSDFGSADDCPSAHRFGGHAFFRLANSFISAQTDSAADRFGSRGLLFAFSVFGIGLLLLSGCNQTFQPIQDSYKAPFSIFGFLDASADTQWVRVAPIRRQISMTPEDVPDMAITVEDMENGNIAIMYDSLFQLQDGRYALNAWGTMDFLEPEQTFTLKAERADGAESHVAITFPPDFPTPRLRIIESGDIAYLYIEGVEHLITVQIRSLAHVFSESAGWDYVDVFRKGGGLVREREPGAYRVLFSYKRVLEGVTGLPRPLPEDLEIEYLHRQIFVASAGPD